MRVVCPLVAKSGLRQRPHKSSIHWFKSNLVDKLLLFNKRKFKMDNTNQTKLKVDLEAVKNALSEFVQGYPDLDRLIKESDSFELKCNKGMLNLTVVNAGLVTTYSKHLK
jgi:hypothetical protein